jgi:hypothetical protein
MDYRVEGDYEKPDEFQVSFFDCPYLERAKQHGMEKEICRLICGWEVEQVNSMGGEMKILSKISDGAEKCTMRVRKTK